MIKIIRILFISFLVIFIFLPKLNASLINNNQENIWSNIFGKVLFNEIGWSVQQTTDGGYVLIGGLYYKSNGMWLIKLNDNGNKEWDKIFDNMIGRYIEQTSDGGFIIVGEGENNILLLKTDENGNEKWRKMFLDGWMWGDRLVQQTSDNGFVIIGTTHDDEDNVKAWLIKTDENGNEKWNRKFGGTEGENGGSVYQVNDGGFIFTGISRSYGVTNEFKRSVWLVKTNNYGIEAWNKTFGEGFLNRGFSIQQTDDNGFIIAGQNDEGAWMIKTDDQGNEEWNRNLAQYGCHVVYSVEQIYDQGFILTGTSGEGSYNNMDLYLIKTDSFGDIIWVKIYGKDGYCEMGNCVRQTLDGGYIVIGTNQLFKIYRGISPLLMNIWVLKTDEMGNTLSMKY